MNIRGTGRRTGASVSESICFAQQGVEGTGACGGRSVISGRFIRETGMRIIHSKAFRRLKDKTQVFLAAQGDHYRTRLTHTLEVLAGGADDREGTGTE